MIYSVFGLGLAFDRPIPRLSGAPRATRVDVEITLGSMPPWRDRLVASPEAVVWHERPAPNGTDTPLLTIWKLGRDYVRLLYADGVEFLIGRQGDRLWAVWPA